MFKVYCPSYKRASTAISHKLFKPERFNYVVRENEAAAYTHHGANIIKIPESSGVSNIANTRNWILENKISEFIVMVDDDLRHIEYIHKREHMKLSVDEIDDMMIKGFQMAVDCGSGMWGINCQTDPRFYKINKPFCFSNIVLGPFVAILDCSLRYDENLFLKEDYDMFLQQMNKHRKVLRLDMYAYACDHQKLAGGCQAHRTNSEEKKQFDLLQKKWGSDLVKRNFKHEGSINPILKLPI